MKKTLTTRIESLEKEIADLKQMMAQLLDRQPAINVADVSGCGTSVQVGRDIHFHYHLDRQTLGTVEKMPLR